MKRPSLCIRVPYFHRSANRYSLLDKVVKCLKHDMKYLYPQTCMVHSNFSSCLLHGTTFFGQLKRHMCLGFCFCVARSNKTPVFMVVLILLWCYTSIEYSVCYDMLWLYWFLSLYSWDGLPYIVHVNVHMLKWWENYSAVELTYQLLLM